MPFGDSALLVEFGDAVNREINRRVLALNNMLERERIEGVEELASTYRSLLVRYNPMKTSYEKIVFLIRDVEEKLVVSSTEVYGRRIVVPVVYGGEYGQDLKHVAAVHSLGEEQVVRLHVEAEYRVYMIGFVVGFPYLGEVADEIATPRLETPRLRVPAGSVGIAEKQTGIYPCEAPGGWQIIGKTPLRLFNPLKQPPALLKAGDTVEFRRISKEEFMTLERNCFRGELSE
jgi:KipI family sensor histidine kinase inhibitor